jgi:hypothetical protein
VATPILSANSGSLIPHIAIQLRELEPRNQFTELANLAS